MATRVTRSRAASNKAIPSNKEPKQLSSPPPTPAPGKESPIRKSGTTTKAKSKNSTAKVKVEDYNKPAIPSSTRKRGAKALSTKAEDDTDALPHNLSKRLRAQDTYSASETPPAKKRAQKSTKPLEAKFRNPQNQAIAEKLTAEFGDPGVVHASPPKSAKKGKASTHTPGVTPFLDHSHPTPEECIEVERLLSKLHGQVQAPKDIPQGSLTVAGCGEVPHVLDALVRTRLSAATSGTNSSRAFQGIVEKFGTVTDSFGRVGVDWNAVRLASQPEVFQAIKSGGLADVKSKDIKKILDMVYAENQARRDALLSHDKHAPGEENEPETEKKAEIARADDDILSLDHLHLLKTNEAFDKLVTYPGIGDKTASCVLLFCMGRPSFAVDTHVYRMCKWLGWVPPKATRNQTFSHCEVRVPGNLKYALHQLFIKHGKTCPRCKANTGPNSARWDEGCVIESLVKRTEARKTGGSGATPKKAAKGGKGSRKRQISESEEDEDKESTMSDFDDDDE